MPAITGSTLRYFSGGGAAVLPLPENSLDFDGATDYLTMSSADWGPYDRTQFSIMFSVKFNSLSSGTGTLFSKGDGSGGEIRIDYDRSNSELDIRTRNSSNAFTSDFVSFTPVIGQWYFFKLDFNGGIVTATDRMGLSIDGVDQSFNGSVAWPTELQTGTEDASLGGRITGSLLSNVTIHQFTFVSGENPATADVYADGSPKSTEEISGLWSRLSADVDAVTDDVRPDWTNNGTVSVVASAP